LGKKISDEFIAVEGARENNLKDISIKLPKNKLVVVTGLSGSGKSSLAFDTIYAEGQRRYMETFSSYARQFLGKMERPDVDKIEGLSPVISIEQKTTGWNPRSTVGTTTEIYDFLRLLYARIGEAYSYVTGKPMVKYSEVQILEKVLEDYDGKKIAILAPVVRSRKGHYRELFEQTRKRGYTRVRVDGELTELRPGLSLDRYKVHDIEIVIDRIKVEEDKRERLSHSLQIAMKTGQSFILILDVDSGEIRPFSKHLMDAESGISYEEPSPNSFSFNSPYGTCPKCKGLGKINIVDIDKVIPDDSKSINNQGIVPFGEVRENTTFKQLRKLAKAYKFSLATPVKDIPKEALNIILYGGGKSVSKASHKYIASDYVYDLADQGIMAMVKHWYEDTTSEKIRQWAQEFMVISTCDECDGYRLRKESLHYKLGEKHIGTLAQMDLDQRTRLATQIGTQLTGVTYILDEPSIGLHQRDNQKLITALKDLSTIGNTVIVVEHDKDIMLAADYLVDLGPGAGKYGGDIIAEGVPKSFLKGKGTTSAYLQNKQRIEVPTKRRRGNGKKLILKGATGNNLKNVTLTIPLGKFVCVTGVSGSGKSSLINETLYPILRAHFYKSLKQPLPYKSITDIDVVDKVIEIDQSPIGRTPRSNPATYTGVFTDIRSLFANVPEAMIRGYKPGRFSFNVKGGRCETCNGGGKKTIEMNFLPDVYVECDTCLGKRYNRETLEIIFKGKTISDVLEMPVSEAVEFFKNIPNIFRKLNTLKEVGLGYITLGQQATTLSGGEAQRVKLAEELSKKSTGNTFYILDEPSTGLHFQDIKHLNAVLNQLVDKGNTVVVIEHNLDIIKIADHIIDIGPEAGRDGGKIVFAGTPEKLVAKGVGHTAKFLEVELELAKAK